jgi:YHS domain-containing protein
VPPRGSSAAFAAHARSRPQQVCWLRTRDVRARRSCAWGNESAQLLRTRSGRLDPQGHVAQRQKEVVRLAPVDAGLSARATRAGLCRHGSSPKGAWSRRAIESEDGARLAFTCEPEAADEWEGHHLALALGGGAGRGFGHIARRARAQAVYAAVTYYFCSENCCDAFARSPARYIPPSTVEAIVGSPASRESSAHAKAPLRMGGRS